MNCSTPGFPIRHHLPEFALTHVHWVRGAIQPSHLLSPPLLLSSVFPGIRVFSSELALHIRWPKYWSVNFSISSSTEYSELVSFNIDWFDLLAVQGTLKGLLQHHNLKASILQCSVFIMVQLSHPYMTTGKTIALTISFIFKSLIFMLCMFSDPYILNAEVYRAKKMEGKSFPFLIWKQAWIDLITQQQKSNAENRPLPYLSSNRSALNHIFKLYYGLT